MKKIAPIILAAALLTASSCSGGRYEVLSGYAQGGAYAVKYNASQACEDRKTVQHAVDSLLLLIDNTLSGYNRSSLVSRINRGEEAVPNPMLKDIYSISYRIWEETGGAVDVAAGPLFDAWGFGFTSDSLPSRAKTDSLMRICGMHRLCADPDSAIARHPVLNFNAIAQGYSCDLIASYLKSLGVKDMLVDIGEIYCQGVNPQGKPWSIGVDSPFDGNQTPGAELKGIWQSDGGSYGVVTSGNYRKYYVRDGKKYAHTIDPRTGEPVSHNLLSATVTAADATTADALATYCMVIGLEEAKEFISASEDIEAYLIYDDDGHMEFWHSDGFRLK